MAQLIVQIDGKPPEIHELTDKAVTVGRETDNVVVIADSSVSRHHAEILAGDGPRTLRDLNSANGTTVNDAPITEKMLKPGDVVHFGYAKATFAATPPAAAKPPLPTTPVKLPAPLVPPRRQDPPPAAAAPLSVAPAPVVPRVAPTPAATPPPETVVPEKTPTPAVSLKLPPGLPKGPLPAVERKPPLSSEATSAVKAVLPPKIESVPSVKEVPPPPAVPPVPIPVIGKATPPTATPPERGRRPDPSLSPAAPKPLPPAPVVHRASTPPSVLTVKPPVENKVSPPVESKARPPFEDKVSPPAESKPSPLVDSKVLPPVENKVSPPAERKVSPPAESKPSPPPESKASPPVENKVSPPVDRMVLPPVENKAQPTTQPARPVAASPTPRPPAVVRPPVGKSLPSELPPVDKKRPAREVAKPAPPTPRPPGELPLVPDDVGRRNPVPAAVKAAPPTPVGADEKTFALDSAARYVSRRRLLVSAAVLILLAAGGTGAWLLHRSNPPAARPAAPLGAVAAGEKKGATAKRFWDQLQATAQTGLQQAQSISLQEYPVLSNGIYDFALIDDPKLDSLMTAMTSRARTLAHVSQEFALLDKTDVDADVAAFAKKIGAHWERAAGLDFDAVNLAWAVHARRMRPVDPGAPALGSADVVAGENRPAGAAAETIDHVNKLANDWLVERVRFAEASKQIDAEEKEIYRKLAARYKDHFK